MTNIRWGKLVRQLDRAPEVIRCAKSCNPWIRITLAYIGAKALAYPFTINFRDGGEIRVENFYDLTTVWSMFFYPAYPVNPSDKVIVDAGANIGAFSLYAARTARNAAVLAIEPFESTFQRLLQTIEANHLQDRVTCFQAALSDADGEVKMSSPDVPSQFRRVLGQEEESATRVKTTTLAAALDAHGIDRVDLLKLDIEGGEYPALLTCPPEVLRRIRRICMEYHPEYAGQPYTLDSISNRLKPAGFECTFERGDGGGYGVAHFANRGSLD
jgi:FkbM family methyltransferase